MGWDCPSESPSFRESVSAVVLKVASTPEEITVAVSPYGGDALRLTH
jgi:hypothetical protein